MTLVDEPEASAEVAGLDYVAADDPGLRRVGCGKGFTYKDVDGNALRDEVTRDRIRQLAIPPAWTEVWICPNADGHLQATGRDVKGRKQYLYHPAWREVRDEEKYAGLAVFAKRLPRMRAAVHTGLKGDRDCNDESHVLALATGLLDRTLIRIGGEVYEEENDTCGLTTLNGDQVRVRKGIALLEFVGKGGVEHRIEVDDKELVTPLDRCRRRAKGDRLLSYRSADGDLVPVDASTVNDHLRAVTGAAVTAKDFRTWGGTVAAAKHLMAQASAETERDAERQILEALDAAAERLGNTRSVCRSSYVCPEVLDAHRSGALADAAGRRRGGRWLGKAEMAVLDVLPAAV